MPETLFVTCPAGNIGSVASARIAEAGAPLSVLARADSAARLPVDVRAHAHVHVGTLERVEDMVAAAGGAAAMLLILPAVYHVDDVIGLWEVFISNALAAIEANAVEHVVFISSQGAERSTAGIAAVSYEVEGRLAQVAANVRALRPGPFMENLLSELEPIRAGMLPLLDPPDTPMRLIAAADIGAVAAELLLDRSWTGYEAIDLRGPAVLSPAQVADALSAGLERDLAYVNISAEELLAEMVKFGMAEGAAQTLVEMIQEGGRVHTFDGPLTRVTSTTLETFARERIRPLLEVPRGGLAAIPFS